LSRAALLTVIPGQQAKPAKNLDIGGYMPQASSKSQVLPCPFLCSPAYSDVVATHCGPRTLTPWFFHQNTTKLLQKRKKDAEWQQALEAKREEFAKRMSDCDHRQTDLKRKCKELRKRVQEKEQEVQETRNKIERATQKHAEEMRLQQEKSGEIEEIMKEVEREEAAYEKLIKDLDSTTRYKLYLDGVCENNEGDFEDTMSILHRFQTLTEQAQLQSEQLIANQDNNEQQKDAFSKYAKVAVNEVVEGNGNLAGFRQMVEELMAQRKEMEKTDGKNRELKQAAIMALGSIELAVDNLHNRAFTVQIEANRLTKAQTQELDRVKHLSRHERILVMLDRLGVFYTDMDAIKEFIKTKPYEALGQEQEEESESASPRRQGAAQGKKKSPRRGGPASPLGSPKTRATRAANNFGNTRATVETSVTDTESVYDGALQ